MAKTVNKDDAQTHSRKSKTRKPGPRPGSTEDAPFDVNTSDDGDFATPKRRVDEDDLKDQHDRKS